MINSGPVESCLTGMQEILAPSTRSRDTSLSQRFKWFTGRVEMLDNPTVAPPVGVRVAEPSARPPGPDVLNRHVE